jgi:ribosomal protein S18 acetylase RimI-like enzyme
MFEDAGVFLSAYSKMVENSALPAIEHQSAYYVEAETGSAAASVWHPPGAEPDPAALIELFREALEPAELEKRLPFFAAIGAAHPKEPHWYLPMIAVDPVRQGKGYGSALLRHALDRVDGDALPAYLESSNAVNIPLYERFGFEVTGEIQAGESPTMWSMWRPAHR